MRTSNTPLNRIIRQTQLLGLVLLSWCWTASAQTQLALVDFNVDPLTYSTNFNLVENGAPVAYWSAATGLTNSDGLNPGTGGGTSGIYTNRSFDFSTPGRQYILSMWCRYSGVAPGTGSGRPLVDLGLVNLTNATINSSGSSNATRNVCLAYWWNTWAAGVGDQYGLLAFAQTTTGAIKDLCAWAKPIQLNYPT